MAAHVIAVYGPKGGMGKTVLASNFAYSLARRSRGKVLLIDLDPHDCGDIALMLGVTPLKSLADLSAESHRISLRGLANQIPRHPDGIWMIPAVREFKQFPLLLPDRLESLLSMSRRIFDFLVVDCGSSLNALNLKAFEKASLILYCTTPDVLALTRAVPSLAEIKALAFPTDMVKVVVNRYDPDGVIQKNIVEQKLSRECIALLPDTPEAVEQSVTEGVPLFSSHPRSPYGRVVEEMTRSILADGRLASVDLHRLDADDSLSAASEGISDSPARHLYGSREEQEIDRLSEIKARIHQQLIEVMDFRQLTPEEINKQDERAMAELRDKTRDAVLGIADKMPEIASRQERQRIVKEVLDEALALGPLEDLLADHSVSEILVNRRDRIYVERKGRLVLTDCRFTSDKHLLGVIERIVAPIGRRVDEKTPMVDARLRDGSRVHAIIPPISIDGPMLTIRKFSREILGPSQLIEFGTLTEEIADFLRACVEARLNIIISGGTGTGKTTLLNVLAGFIPSAERILTAEDAAELRLSQEHVGRLEARPPNLQGEGAIPIRELVRNTLRMRPDRIIVGECRGAEALDMLQAMNTGHDGSMTTVHANSPRDAVSRLETLVMFAGLDLPSRAIREQIASAIQLIVQITRYPDGARKVSAVTEVAGFDGPSIRTQDIYLFRQKGVDRDGRVRGSFTATGLVPGFAEIFRQKGIRLPASLGG